MGVGAGLYTCTMSS